MKKRKLPPLGAGSMADVAFLLLVFFLIATTIETDAGLNLVLPPWTENETIQPVPEYNVLSIQLNALDDLYVEGEKVRLSDLNQRTKQMVLSDNEKHLS